MANLMQDAKEQITALVTAAFRAAQGAGELPGGDFSPGKADVPKDSKNGDYATNAAMVNAKALGQKPRDLAETLLRHMDLGGSWFERAEIAGPGFINFFLGGAWYSEVLRAIEREGGSYGSVDDGHGERVMVEFVSANPTGPMTIGNARGGVLGDTLAAVLERAGYKVWREFYVNDAGNQVELFARSLEARYIQQIKGEDSVEFPEDGYHGDDIRELAAKIRGEYGEKLLDMDEDERRNEMMRFGIEHNIALMRQHLERYRISYDCWFRESRLHESGYVEETVRLLGEAGHTYEKDGAVWLRNSAFGADKDEVLRRANGYYTYYAVDMAYHRNKFVERGFDRVIDIWGADHHGHAIRFKASLGALGIEAERLDFLIMQLVRLVRDGEAVKVSKRTGKAITLNDLLDEISVDACRFFFNARPDSHLEFDMDLAVRQDSDNPVYYVQYAHARICSILENLAADGVSPKSCGETELSLLTDPSELELIKQLSALPEEIRASARDYDPSRLNRYLTELASCFHRFYGSCRIKCAEPALRDARLRLALSVRDVIANVLGLLGVSAPEKM